MYIKELKMHPIKSRIEMLNHKKKHYTYKRGVGGGLWDDVAGTFKDIQNVSEFVHQPWNPYAGAKLASIGEHRGGSFFEQNKPDVNILIPQENKIYHSNTSHAPVGNNFLPYKPIIGINPNVSTHIPSNSMQSKFQHMPWKHVP